MSEWITTPERVSRVFERVSTSNWDERRMRLIEEILFGMHEALGSCAVETRINHAAWCDEEDTAELTETTMGGFATLPEYRCDPTVAVAFIAPEFMS